MDGLVKEMCSENYNLVPVLVKLLYFNTDISTVTENVLSPVHTVLKALFWVLEPEKLSLTLLGIGTGCDKILATITVEVHPESHVIEVVVLEGSDVDSLEYVCEVVRIHAEDEHSSILFAWDEETVWHKNGTLTENILGDRHDIVGPLETDGVQLGSLEASWEIVDNCFLDVSHHVDVSTAHCTEARYKQEVIVTLELAYIVKSGLLLNEMAFGYDFKITICNSK